MIGEVDRCIWSFNAVEFNCVILPIKAVGPSEGQSMQLYLHRMTPRTGSAQHKCKEATRDSLHADWDMRFVVGVKYWNNTKCICRIVLKFHLLIYRLYELWNTNSPLKPKQRSQGEFIVFMPKLSLAESPWQQAVNSNLLQAKTQWRQRVDP